MRIGNYVSYTIDRGGVETRVISKYLRGAAWEGMKGTGFGGTLTYTPILATRFT